MVGGINRRQFIGAAAALGLGVGCATTRNRGRSGGADLLLVNGKVWTQDPNRPEAEAVALSGGKIVGAGSVAEVAKLVGAEARRIDLGGRRVIPGLVDVHMHPTRGGRFYAAELRWDGVTSVERGLAMIAEQAKRTPEGQWVRVVGGWSPYQFVERRMPTPEELTRAAPNTPVFVLFLYSGGILNQAALKALNITAQTKTPPGTAYELGSDGSPTGRIMAEPNPTLLYQTIGALPPLSAGEQALSTRHFYQELNRFGLTSVIDAGGGGHRFPEDYGGTEALAKDGLLPLRVSNYLFPQKKGNEMEEFTRWTEDFKVHTNMADGLEEGYVVRGGGEFLVWAAGDFENFLAERPDITERERWRPQLMAVTRHLLANEWPLRIHATYDESINHILDVFEEADELERGEGRKGLRGIRWAIDHAETAMPETIDRVRRLSGGIATQSRMAYAGEYFIERYGKSLAGRAPAFGDMLDAGIPVGLGSDATRVSSYNPWVTLYWAVTGKSVGGTPLLNERHRVSRAKALELHTLGSAWFSQEERIKGRIAPGQLGDLTVLSDDYFEIGAEGIRNIESVLTVTGGEIVYGAGDFAKLKPELPTIEPTWSPVSAFGGYQTAQT